VKNKKIWIIALVVILVMAGAIWKNRSAKTEELPRISAEAASTKAMEEELTATGKFIAREEEHILSRVNSRVVELLVEEGADVQQGELLILLDTEDLEKEKQRQLIALQQVEMAVRQNLLNLRLEYRSQLIRVQQLQDSLEKNIKVHSLGSLSDEELRLSRDALTGAENGLAAVQQRLNLLCGLPADAEPVMDDSRDNSIIAEAPEVAQQRLALKRIEENIAHCSIKAGMTGRLASLPFSKGNLVTQGMELALIQDINSVEAEIWVDEVDIGKIQPGDAVEVEADSIIGVTLNGQIHSISPRIDRIGNSMASRVRVSLDPTDHQLRPGGSCRALIHSLARSSALTVPIQAVKPEGGDVLVYRLNEDTADRYKLEEVVVATGLSTLDEMEILSGLEEGDLVATSNVDNLRNGMVIRLEEDS